MANQTLDPEENKYTLFDKFINLGQDRSPAGLGKIGSTDLDKLYGELAKKVQSDISEVAPLEKKALAKEPIAPIISPQEAQSVAAIRKRLVEGPLTSQQSVQEMLDEQGQLLKSASEEAQKRKAQRMLEAYGEFEKAQPQPLSTGDIIARSLIAIAPALIGKAAAGSLGGVAGGVASVTALSEIEKQKQEKLKQAQETAKLKLASATQLSKDELDHVSKMEEELNKQRVEAGMLPMKMDYLTKLDILKQYGTMQIVDAKNSLEQEVQKNKRLDTLEANSQRMMLELLKLAQKDKQAETKVKQKGSPDLGFGFKMKGEDWTADMRKKAADRVGAMGSFHSAIDDLKGAINKAGVSGVTTWSEAGRDVQQALSRFMEASRTYNKSGASFSISEQQMAKSSGFDPLGNYKDALKLSFDPSIASKVLDHLKASTRKQIASEVTPQQVEDILKPAQQGVKLTREIYDKMTDQEKISYKSASPAQRVQIIKSVQGR